MKNALLINGESTEQVQITKGMTPTMLLESVGLSRELLVCKRGSLPFGPDEVIFDQISDGEKLLVASQAVVGLNL